MREELGVLVAAEGFPRLPRAPWIGAEMGGWWEVWELVRAAIDPGRAMNPNALGGPEL